MLLEQYFSPICGTCRRLKKLYGLPGYLLPYTLSWVAGALNGGQNSLHQQTQLFPPNRYLLRQAFGCLLYLTHGQKAANKNNGLALPDTRIFSPLAVARLCVTIGRYWYLFKRLTVL